MLREDCSIWYAECKGSLVCYECGSESTKLVLLYMTIQGLLDNEGQTTYKVEDYFGINF